MANVLSFMAQVAVQCNISIHLELCMYPHEKCMSYIHFPFSSIFSLMKPTHETNNVFISCVRNVALRTPASC